MNTENINKLLARLQQDDGSHLAMRNWVGLLPHAVEQLAAEGEDVLEDFPSHYVECGTAFCMCGWANMLRLTEAGVDWKAAQGPFYRFQFADEVAAREWLGLSEAQANELFYMGASNDAGWWQRNEFDEYDKTLRRDAAVYVLERLRDGGAVDWPAAIKAAQAQPL